MQKILSSPEIAKKRSEKIEIPKETIQIIKELTQKITGEEINLDNIQSVLTLRTKYMSGHWDEIVEDYLLAA